MARITINPSGLKPPETYSLLLGIVVPRPIAFVSTISASGLLNLAPYSFFQAVCSNPPTVLFCPSRDRNGNIKHTLRNIQETGEFVIGTVAEVMAESMNLTSATFPEDVSEFDVAGFTPVKAELVKPYLIGESPANLECRLNRIIEISDKPAGGCIVIGEVLRIHIREEYYDHLRRGINPRVNDVIGRLGGSDYCTIKDSFTMPHPRFNAEGEIIADSYKRIADH